MILEKEMKELLGFLEYPIREELLF